MKEELEAIKQRLVVLEAALQLSKDREAAEMALLFAALRVLYRRDPTALQEWIVEAQSTSAFGLAAHDMKPPQTLPILLAALQEIQDALRKYGPPPAPQQDSIPPP